MRTASRKQIPTLGTDALIEGTGNAALTIDDIEAIASLRSLLNTCNYTSDAIRGVLGARSEALQQFDIPYYVRRISGDSPLNTLIKLFVLNIAVPASDVDKCFAPLSIERLEHIGLLRREGEETISQIQFIPYDGLVFACDSFHGDPANLPPDYVIGVNPTSITLAAFTVRQPYELALDLGTGCGVQSLLTARHCKHVIGTDINPRALNFAEFNALLNGVENVEFRKGNLFEPVAGLQFDLIVCNPPYVISPDSSYTFRDSGLSGDSLCKHIIQEAPTFMREDGFTHLLCNWVVKRGEGWAEPLSDWVKDSGCDSLLIYCKTEDPLTYADNWNQQVKIANSAAYTAALDRWVHYFRNLNIDAIASGAVILHRRPGRHNWVRREALPASFTISGNAHLEYIFDAEEYLSEHTNDATLLKGTFRLAGHRLDQSLACREGKYTVFNSTLRLEQGLGFSGKVDAYVLNLLSRCDGHQSLGDILAEMSRVTGFNKEDLVRTALPVVRQLIAQGFLVE